MPILFTQYKLPKGITEDVTIDSTSETEQMAHELLDFGFKFDIEMLTTGMISMTCEKLMDGDYELISMELSQNGPEIIQKTVDLVINAYNYWKSRNELQRTDDHNWHKRMQAVIDARDFNVSQINDPNIDDYPNDLSLDNEPE